MQRASLADLHGYTLIFVRATRRAAIKVKRERPLFRKLRNTDPKIRRKRDARRVGLPFLLLFSPLFFLSRETYDGN